VVAWGGRYRQEYGVGIDRRCRCISITSSTSIRPKLSSRKKTEANMADPPSKKQRVDQSSSISSSQTRVFATPELLEHILIQLPMRDLLLCQRVSHHFQDIVTSSPAIQERLFFRAIPRTKFTPVTARKPYDNLLLRPAFPFFFEKNAFSEPKKWPTHEHFLTHLPWSPQYRLSHLRGRLTKESAAEAEKRKQRRLRSFLRKSASWRRMFPIQPPPKMLRVAETVQARNWSLIAIGEIPEADLVQKSTVNDENQYIRMCHLYDLVEEYTSKFPPTLFTDGSSFAINWAADLSPEARKPRGTHIAPLVHADRYRYFDKVPGQNTGSAESSSDSEDWETIRSKMEGIYEIDPDRVAVLLHQIQGSADGNQVELDSATPPEKKWEESDDEDSHEDSSDEDVNPPGDMESKSTSKATKRRPHPGQEYRSKAFREMIVKYKDQCVWVHGSAAAGDVT
jgi:hypothetical protein